MAHTFIRLNVDGVLVEWDPDPTARPGPDVISHYRMTPIGPDRRYHADAVAQFNDRYEPYGPARPGERPADYDLAGAPQHPPHGPTGAGPDDSDHYGAAARGDRALEFDDEPPNTELEEFDALQEEADDLAAVLRGQLAELIRELSPHAGYDLADAELYASAQASDRAGEFADLVARYLVADAESRIFELKQLLALEVPELSADPRRPVAEPARAAQREALVRAFAALPGTFAVDVAQLPVDAITRTLIDVLRRGLLWYDADLARELIEKTVRYRMADIRARWSGDKSSADTPPGESGDANETADAERLFAELEEALGAAGTGGGGFGDGSAGSAADDGGDGEDIRRLLARRALSRLPQRDSRHPVGTRKWVSDQLMPTEYSSLADRPTSDDGFVADGREQAAVIAEWWHGLTDESLPPALLELLDRYPGGLPGSGLTGLTLLQAAVFEQYWSAFTGTLGIPLSVTTVACGFLVAGGADPEAYPRMDLDVAAHLNAVAMQEGTTERDGAEIIPDDVAFGIRFADIFSGSAAFAYGDLEHADRRIYVVMPQDGPPRAEDYRRMHRIGVGLVGEMRDLLRKTVSESERAAAPRVAVVGVLRRAPQPLEQRGLLLRRDIAVDAALDPLPGEFDIFALGNGSITALFASRGERLAAEGLSTLVLVDPARSGDVVLAVEVGANVRVLLVNSVTGSDESDVAGGSSAGVARQDPVSGALWIRGIDGAKRADLLRAGKSSLMRRVFARIGLRLDISAYLPGLEVYGRRMPDLQRCLPVGNEFQLAAGVDGFRLPADATDWRQLEQTIRGRLEPVTLVVDGEPVTLVTGGGVALLEKVFLDVRRRFVVNADGVAETQRPPLDSLILVVDDGEDAHRADGFYDETTGTWWMADTLVGGPLEYDRWLQVQPYRTVRQAWVAGFRYDADGDLKPVNKKLHAPSAVHLDMPKRPIRGAPRAPPERVDRTQLDSAEMQLADAGDDVGLGRDPRAGAGLS